MKKKPPSEEEEVNEADWGLDSGSDGDGDEAPAEEEQTEEESPSEEEPPSEEEEVNEAEWGLDSAAAKLRLQMKLSMRPIGGLAVRMSLRMMRKTMM